MLITEQAKVSIHPNNSNHLLNLPTTGNITIMDAVHGYLSPNMKEETITCTYLLLYVVPFISESVCT